MRKYTIANSSEIPNFNFSELVDIDESHSRKSVDGSKVLARFEGSTPNFLEGKTQYDHSEILTILAGSEWTDPNPPGG